MLKGLPGIVSVSIKGKGETKMEEMEKGERPRKEKENVLQKNHLDTVTHRVPLRCVQLKKPLKSYPSLLLLNSSVFWETRLATDVHK